VDFLLFLILTGPVWVFLAMAYDMWQLDRAIERDRAEFEAEWAVLMADLERARKPSKRV
jgi:hypothetical protein